jgi:hypothetical protein
MDLTHEVGDCKRIANPQIGPPAEHTVEPAPAFRPGLDTTLRNDHRRAFATADDGEAGVRVAMPEHGVHDVEVAAVDVSR